MEDSSRIRVLFVDDEASLLEAIRRTLHGTSFEASTAPSGQAGLEVLGKKGPFAAVVSDLRMPGMDGVTFLRLARDLVPDTVRVLFTGQPDLDNAIAAVNEGSIFRFITKPCSSNTLLNTLQAAGHQYRLITAERVLLEETLRGSIQALTEVLALANPTAFGRATRIRQYVTALLRHFGLRDVWPAEVAAMLSQIGCVTLPPHTLEKLYHGETLNPGDQIMIGRMPTVVDQLLSHIPRLEPVRQILAYQHKRYDGSGPPRDDVSGEAIPWGARALKVALDLDALEAQGASTTLSFDTLRGRMGWYDPAILEALAQVRGSANQESDVRELPLQQLAPGMFFAQDVWTRQGLLLIARGQEVTPSLLERMRNFSLGLERPIRVVVRGLGRGTGSSSAA